MLGLHDFCLAALLSGVSFPPLSLAYKIAFKLKYLFWTEVTLLKGGQRCIRLGVWGVSGRDLCLDACSLDATTAAKVPWGLRGGHRVGDTRRALSGRGEEGVPG